MSAPPVSVVMPVYDAAPYLDHSVRSILAQTFEDFELVVLENGSRDRSREILRRWADADPRVRIHEHPHPLGSAGSSNRVISFAKAPLIARMDADDLCHRDRLARQLEVIRSADDVVAVATLEDGIDAAGRRVRSRDRWSLVRCRAIPFPHGSTMMRRGAFERAGGYRERTRLAEDADLLLRLADRGRIMVLTDALYSYRYHSGSITLSSELREVARSLELRGRSIAERRAGNGRDGVVEEPASGQAAGPDTVAAALYYIGAMRLWAGERPSILREVVASDARRLSPAWLRTLSWATWATLSPATLRLAVRGLVRVRDAAAGMRLDPGRPFEWRPR